MKKYNKKNVARFWASIAKLTRERNLIEAAKSEKLNDTYDPFENKNIEIKL